MAEQRGRRRKSRRDEIGPRGGRGGPAAYCLNTFSIRETALWGSPRNFGGPHYCVARGAHRVEFPALIRHYAIFKSGPRRNFSGLTRSYPLFLNPLQPRRSRPPNGFYAAQRGTRRFSTENRVTLFRAIPGATRATHMIEYSSFTSSESSRSMWSHLYYHFIPRSKAFVAFFGFRSPSSRRTSSDSSIRSPLDTETFLQVFPLPRNFYHGYSIGICRRTESPRH